MKQYTTPEQTAKLIELGFEKPKGWCVEGISSRLIMYKHKDDDEDFNYSVGELIEMLPSHIGWCELNIWHIWHLERWVICFDPEKYTSADTELIDAAYNLIVKLKEEGVI